MHLQLPRSRAARAAVLGIVLLALAIGTCALRGRPVPAVRVVRRDLVETLVLSGRVLSRSKAAVGVPFAASVASVLVDEGTRVRKGQPLVLLDDREARAAVEKGRADLEQAVARLAQLRTTSARVNAEALVQARLRLEEAQRKLARTEALRHDGFVSETDVEDAVRAVDLARSQVTSADTQARSSAQGGSDDRLALAAVESARAGLASAETRLAQMRVESPASGTVLTRSVEPGKAVSPGEALLVVALDTPAELLAQPDEKNLGALRVGLAAKASADAFPGLAFPATVSLVAPNVDLSRGTVDVRFRVPDPPAYLRTDMTLSIEIEVGRKARTLAIPLAAVRDASRAPSVLVGRSGRAELRPVSLGIRGTELVEVTGGLSESEVVLVPTGPAIRAGIRVRPLLPAGG